MIYFDNCATTKVDDRVIELISDIMKNQYVNIDSEYSLNENLKKMIKEKKEILKKRLGLNPNNFYFTSGGGEANNIALLSSMRKYKKGNFLITTIEHPSVIETAKELVSEGYELRYIPVDEKGYIKIDIFKTLIDEDTKLISIIGINNEIGTIQDFELISKIIKDFNKDIIFHIDYVQGLNHHNFDFSKIDVDILSISSHKIHGPKGVGAIYINDKINLKKQIFGENIFNGFIPRTFPSELVLGFLKAMEIYDECEYEYISSLNSYFIEKLKDINDVCINSPSKASKYILNISFKGIRSEVIQNYLSSHNIYISTGSACSSKKKDSHVLKALNLEKKVIESAIRISFSKYNTKEEIDKFFEILIPFHNMAKNIK